MMNTILYAYSLVLPVLLVAGCPTMPGAIVPAGQIAPSWLDGDWWLDYSDSPNPTQLTFTDGRVTSELAGGYEPVAILWSSPAVIAGRQVTFSYASWETGLVNGEVVTVEGVLTFSGTIQDDGSISGRTTIEGTMNGMPVANTVGFIMYRL